jgi:hypothetical protein
MTPDEIDAFLSSQQVCRVATIGAQDRPHVAPLNSLIRPVIVRKPPSSNWRMSRVPWNFGGGPVSIRLRSPAHHA